MDSCPTGRPNICVAVVDDDESMCRSFGRLLRLAGFHSIAYPSAEALLADTQHPQLDCLVLDVQLPGMSGLELRRRLGAVHDPTPVIFITAHDAPEVRARAFASGCAGYFRKTDPGTLVLEAIMNVVQPGDRHRPPQVEDKAGGSSVHTANKHLKR